MSGELSTYQQAVLQAMGIPQWQKNAEYCAVEDQAVGTDEEILPSTATSEQHQGVVTEQPSREVPPQFGRQACTDIELCLEALGLTGTVKWLVCDSESIARRQDTIQVPSNMMPLSAADKQLLWRLLCLQ